MFELFIDLDGVLVDFERGVLEVTGKPVHELHPSRMWSALARTPEFYAKLHWTEDGRVLWDFVSPFHPTVLTGLPRGNWARPQKLDWCARELGPEVPVITCMSRDKARVAETATESGKTPVLVDDRESIRESWERMGGRFVLHRSAEASIHELTALGL